VTEGDALARVYAYHDRTKHHVNRFARSLGYLDWANQPNPFRTYEGAPRIDLVEPLQALHGDGGSLNVAQGSSPVSSPLSAVGYDDLFADPATEPRAGGLPAISALFRYSMGLSAWKEAGASRWALRVNPSSGNLHPTEAYVLLGPGIASVEPGVFHYAPDAHALEQRCTFARTAWAEVCDGLPPGACLVGLTSIHWREAWKYGERAFRYCQHDVGHALAALRLAAALLGWQLRVWPGWSGATLARVLGVDRAADVGDAEREDPACLCLAWPGNSAARCPVVSEALVDAVANGEWHGRANELSESRIEWEEIQKVAECTQAAASADPAPARVAREPGAPPSRAVAAPSAASVILRRRSAVDMDGRSAMDLDRFLFLLGRVMPGTAAPFDAPWWPPAIHLVLFVHRVTGLQPGIYVLPRTADALSRLQTACYADFAWIAPESAVAARVPLCLLTPLDVRAAARQLSCTQNIAADGFFSLGMLAEFDAGVASHGPAFYRALFWEAGMIGQVLYLEAEAVGARGTGIGCFFDDAVHEVLGLDDHQFQSLYHFTVGAAVDDPRLQTRPGYPWE